MVDDTTIFSSYSLNSPYWIIIEGGPLEPLLAAQANALYQQPNLMGFAVGAQWAKPFTALMKTFPEPTADMPIRATVIPAETLPSLQEIQLSLKPISEIQSIADTIWLANYLGEGRLVCYLQPVVNRDGAVSGYEAFARIDAPNGTVITGGDIMRASRALRLEYQVDRLMHKQAIQKFVSLNLSGTLFINFLTNFIHLPQAYLSGLAESIARANLPPQSVALDVPLSNYSHDTKKLQSIAQCCQEFGVALAFDGVATLDGLPDLLTRIKPAFVKLDTAFTQSITTAETRATVKNIVTQVHQCGSKIIAEMIENAQQHATYRDAGVDLFQGYHFGAPMRNPSQKL